ncbi:glycosyl hydrolase family 43, partial [Phocaeicola vulgatus]
MMKYLSFLLFLLLKEGTVTAQNNLVVNGIPWFDDKGNIVNAHGACIVEENGR